MAMFSDKETRLFGGALERAYDYLAALRVLNQARQSLAVIECKVDRNPYPGAVSLIDVAQGGDFTVVSLAHSETSISITLSGELVWQNGDLYAIDSDGALHNLMDIGVIPHPEGWSTTHITIKMSLGVPLLIDYDYLE